MRGDAEGIVTMGRSVGLIVVVTPSLWGEIRYTLGQWHWNATYYEGFRPGARRRGGALVRGCGSPKPWWCDMIVRDQETR